MSLNFIRPRWPAPAQVRSAVSTRGGEPGLAITSERRPAALSAGAEEESQCEIVPAVAASRARSKGVFACFNLGAHVGDDAGAVAANRRSLRAQLELPAEPVWLSQVHGARTLMIDADLNDLVADAAVTHTPGVVAAVLTADCLPVLLCDRDGTRVAAAHAGWRGLAAGVIEATVAALGVPADRLLAWLGPAIGPERFEVGDEVRAAFLDRNAEDSAAFQCNDRGRWQADIYALARARLLRAGVTEAYGGGFCTYTDSARFFSYRRDGQCGRMASLIWLAS